MKNKKLDESGNEAAPLKYSYLCPACTNVAITTSNKMLGVKVVCVHCGMDIELDNVGNYKEL